MQRAIADDGSRLELSLASRSIIRRFCRFRKRDTSRGRFWKLWIEDNCTYEYRLGAVGGAAGSDELIEARSLTCLSFNQPDNRDRSTSTFRPERSAESSPHSGGRFLLPDHKPRIGPARVYRCSALAVSAAD